MGPPGPGEQRPAEHAPCCPPEHGAPGTRRMAWVARIDRFADQPFRGDGPAGCCVLTGYRPSPYSLRVERGGPQGHRPVGTYGAFPQPCRLPQRHTWRQHHISRSDHLSALARCAFPVEVTTRGHAGSRPTDATSCRLAAACTAVPPVPSLAAQEGLSPTEAGWGQLQSQDHQVHAITPQGLQDTH